MSTGSDPSGLAVSPDGKNAYVANFLDNTVSQYSVDPTTGTLSAKTPATGPTGNGPLVVAVSPNGGTAYAIDEDDDAISQYSIDPTTGKLSATTPATVPTGGNPRAIAISPDNRSAYVTDTGDETIAQYSVDATTGTLSPKAPATVAIGSVPSAIAVGPDADVSVQTSAPTSVKSGSDLTYTITVSNAGPSSAWHVVLRDELPFGTQFLKASPGGAQCAAPRAGTKGGTLVCKLGHDQERQDSRQPERPGQNQRQRQPGRHHRHREGLKRHPRPAREQQHVNGPDEGEITTTFPRG